MNVLITGATGFVGKNLIEYLKDKDFNIFALVRKNYDFSDKNIKIIKGDLFNLSNLKKIDFDVVIHIAGLTKTLYSKNFYYINSRGTSNLIQFFKEKKLRHFIFISSLAAFGPTDKNVPIDELSRPLPVSHYGMSKLIAEKILKKSGITYTIIRPPAVFGPFDKDILTYFKMVNSRIVLNSGDADRLYSLIYVKDLVKLIYLTILNESAFNEDFFISYDTFYTVFDIIKSIENSSGKKSLKINLPEFFVDIIGYPMQVLYAFTKMPPLLNLDKLKEIKQRNWICSGEKPKTILNFSYSYKFEEAIKETYKWYKEKNYI